MAHGMTKTYIWSLPTRLFHISLIVVTALVYISSEFDRLLQYHVIFAYAMFVLLFFRVIWGFVGVKHSLFKDFNFNLIALKHYMLNIFSSKKEFKGHNPASSWAILFMLVFAFFSIITGVLLFGVQEGMGILSFLNTSFYKDMDLFKDIHEVFTSLFVLVVLSHIAGVLLEKFLHNTQNIKSMITGYKDLSSKHDNINLNTFQKIFSFFWILSPIILVIYLLYSPSNILIKDSNKAIDYKVEHELFYGECISCHTLFPPFLLDEKSWVYIMDNLENHFRDDASLEQEDINAIKKYLVNYSAKNSTKESAYHMYKSLENKEIIAITKSSYWKKRHKSINKKVLQENNITKQSDCKSCHKNIENGLLNDKDIKIF